MTATFQLKSYELTEDLFKKLKSFEGRDITITVKEPHDETAFLMRNEANRRRILKSIEADKQGKVAHTMTLEEAEALL